MAEIDPTDNPYYRATLRQLLRAYPLGNEQSVPLLAKLEELEDTLLRPEGKQGPGFMLQLIRAVNSTPNLASNAYSERAIDLHEFNCERRLPGVEKEVIATTFRNLLRNTQGDERLDHESPAYAMLMMLLNFHGTVVEGNMLDDPTKAAHYCHEAARWAGQAGMVSKAVLEVWRGNFFRVDAIIINGGSLVEVAIHVRGALDGSYAAMQDVLADDLTMANWTQSNGPNRQREKHYAMGDYENTEAAESDLAMLSKSDPTAYAVYLAIHTGMVSRLTQYATDESLDPTLRGLVWLRLARIARELGCQLSDYWHLLPKTPAYLKKIAEIELRDGPVDFSALAPPTGSPSA